MVAASGKRARPRVRALVTCEHGGNRIPPAYRAHFAGFEQALESHRGYDPGALVLARELARACAAPLVSATVSRLLVELNRSPGHSQLFSERTRALSRETRARIVARYYEPYRAQVERHVREGVHGGCRVLHLSSHSFTPVLDGVERNADVGLLYDPRRRLERELCEAWSARLRRRIAPLTVRRNYPYRGHADGLTTWLRRRFPESHYIGIEIEVNQKHVAAGGRQWRQLREGIVGSAVEILAAA